MGRRKATGGIIKRARLTSIDMILRSGSKQKYLMRLQRPLKKLPQPNAEIVDLTRNPNKVVLGEEQEPFFFQVFYYKNRPFTLAVVCGNRLIAFPYDLAFILKDSLEKYFEQMKEFKRGERDEML